MWNRDDAVLPLYAALENRAEEGKLRFHMPGHKGKDVLESPLAGAMFLDFTELYGTGNLYDGAYPIADAEVLMARAYRAPKAYFLTGGATQGLYAAISLAVKPGDRVLMERGCHRSVYHALALVDGRPVFVQAPEIAPFGAAGPLAPEMLEDALADNPDISTVVITSPTYYGVVSDVKALAKIAHSHGARLIVDCAHGAHFPFTPGCRFPVELGADIVVCSMHKTLPALGQAALILTNGRYVDTQVRRATAVYGTSSPSYNIMASMDLCRAFMESEGAARCRRLVQELAWIREKLNSSGVFWALCWEGMDPLRLCVCTAPAGLSGYRAAWMLERDYGIVCEMADTRNVLFIITPADSVEDLQALQDALCRLEREALNAQDQVVELPQLPEPVRVLMPREAMFAETEEVALGDAANRIAAQNLCPYPPGIPAVAAGELITRVHVEYLCNREFDPNDPVSVVREHRANESKKFS